MGWHMFDQLSQLYPPRPSLTQKEVPDLDNKVYLVTGANQGLGKEVAQILYSKNARVYVAARSEDKAQDAITAIKEANPSSAGSITFLKLDLADLSTIKASAQEFLTKESKLHVLFNNAGIMMPAQGSTTKQGYESQLGVNNIGTYMFTKLLTPTLISTAKTEAPGTVRVIWVASSAAEAPVVPSGGVKMTEIDQRDEKGSFYCYALSKAGNYLHAVEYAKRYRTDGVVSLALNPGNLDSELWRNQRPLFRTFLRTFVLHDNIYGAYTQLFAALSPQVTLERSGEWVGPWGRFLTIRRDLALSVKSKDEGGNGSAAEFWDWTDKQVHKFM